MNPRLNWKIANYQRWLIEEDVIVVRLRLRESCPELASIAVVFSARFGWENFCVRARLGVS